VSEPSRSVAVYAVPGDVDTARLAGGTAVVIDVLRATSVAAVALAAGAAALVPTAEPPEAFALRDRLGAAGKSALLCGERGGVRIPGFDLGNSPLEYVPAAVGGRVLVQCSTNGTGAMIRCAGAGRILLASLGNTGAVVRALRETGDTVHLVCSGKEGRPAAEDLAVAGLLVEALGAAATGAAGAARSAWAACRPDPAAFLAGTEHGRYLASVGFADDLPACAARDALSLVPELRREAEGPLAGLLVTRDRAA